MLAGGFGGRSAGGRGSRWGVGGGLGRGFLAEIGFGRGSGKNGRNGRNGGWTVRARIGWEVGGGYMGAQEVLHLVVEEGLGFEPVVELAGAGGEAGMRQAG